MKVKATIIIDFTNNREWLNLSLSETVTEEQVIKGVIEDLRERLDLDITPEVVLEVEILK